MTIAKTGTSASYAGNGATTAFAFPYRFLQDNDLQVYIVVTDGTATLQTLTTDYTVSNNGDETGGTVTMIVAPASGETLLIERQTDQTQSTDYVNNDPFPAETHEDALDKLTLIAQEEGADGDKHITFPSGDTASPMLPIKTTRANKVFGFDAAGGIAMVDTDVFQTVSYETRAEFVTAVAGGLSVADGGIVAAGGLFYVAGGTATAISDLQGWLPQGDITPQHFGATGSGDETAKIQSAADYAIIASRPLLVYGDLTCTTVSVSSGITVKNCGRINGEFQILGDYVQRSNTVLPSGGPFSAGISSFSGDFSAYTPGDIVIVEHNGAGGAGPGTNESGVDFLEVATASGTTLTTTTSTRWGYSVGGEAFDAKISKVTGAFRSGAISRESYEISGDYTSLFSAGDVIRVENTVADDTMWTDTGRTPSLAGSENAYFEYVTVKSIDATSIKLVEMLTYDNEDVWLIKANPVRNAQIDGGFISQIDVESAYNLKINNVDCDQLFLRYVQNGNISSVNAYNADGQTRSLGMSYLFRCSVSNIVAMGAQASADNATVKLLTAVHSVFSNITISDTTSDGSGNCFGFQTDVFFTPYTGQTRHCVFDGITSERPKLLAGGADNISMFIGTGDQCTYNNINAGGEIEFYLGVNSVFTNVLSSRRIDMNDCVRCDLSSFRAPFINVAGNLTGAVRSGLLTGPATDNSNRVVWVRNGTDTDVDDCLLEGVRSISTTAGDTSFYVGASSRVSLTNCSDIAGVAASLTQSGATDLNIMGGDFRNTDVPDDSQTIASGSISLDHTGVRIVRVDTEGAASTDNLEFIVPPSGYVTGTILVVRAASSSRDVVLLDNGSGSNNFRLNGSFTLTNTNDTISLMWQGTIWQEISRSDNQP